MKDTDRDFLIATAIGAIIGGSLTAEFLTDPEPTVQTVYEDEHCEIELIE